MGRWFPFLGFAIMLLMGTAAVGESGSQKDIARDISSKCGGLGEGVFNVSPGMFCLNGAISEKTGSAVSSVKSRLNYVYVDTKGGDVDAAIIIGRRLFADRATLIIGESCMSACANYLVPGSSHVILQENSLIVMHGSIPRGIASYARRERGPDSISGKSSKLDSKFLEIRNGILRREMDFFDFVGVDDAYLTRSIELVRSERVRRQIESNVPIGGDSFFIPDKLYLRVFGIDVTFIDGEKLDYIKCRTRAINPKGLVVYGFFGQSLNGPDSNGSVTTDRCFKFVTGNVF